LLPACGPYRRTHVAGYGIMGLEIGDGGFFTKNSGSNSSPIPHSFF